MLPNYFSKITIYTLIVSILSKYKIIDIVEDSMFNVVKNTTKSTSILLAVFLFSGMMPVFAQQASRIAEENATKYLYGIAAWYGDDFNGQTTASGAKYTPESLTGAHRSLPFGTRIEVENLSNGKKIEVIINDRGPFEQNRVINLSKQAATILGFLSEETTFVKITIIELGTSLPSPMGVPKPPIGKDIPQDFANTPAQILTPDAPVEVAPIEEADDQENLDDVYEEADNAYEDGAEEDGEIVGDDVYANNTDLQNEESGMLANDIFANEDQNNLNNEDFNEEDIETISNDIFANDEDLFAGLDDELDFMDDDFQSELTSEDSQLKGQVITNTSSPFADNNPRMEPTGFNSNANEVLIDDPLSNITIGPDDEYVVAPSPSQEALDSVPYGMTPEEKRLLEENASEDPFADLFNESSDPYSFQDEVNSSLTSPTVPTEKTNNAYNLDSDVPGSTTDYSNYQTPIEDNYGYDDFQTPIEDNSGYDNFQTPIEDNSGYENFQTPIEDNYGYDNFQTPIEPVEAPLPPAPLPVAPPVAPTPPVEEPFAPQKMGNHYVIQLGAFSKQKNALDLYNKLRSAGFNAFITDIKIKGKNLMRVRVGYFTTIDEAIPISQELEQIHKIENRIIKIDYEDEKLN